MIKVRNLTKNYGDVKAVKGISFDVEMGHVYGFLGPNGAGKSTTMNMICGCLAPSEGSVTIDGCDILEDAVEAKNHIGYLPEIPVLECEPVTLDLVLIYPVALDGVIKTACFACDRPKDSAKDS